MCWRGMAWHRELSAIKLRALVLVHCWVGCCSVKPLDWAEEFVCCIRPESRPKPRELTFLFVCELELAFLRKWLTGVLTPSNLGPLPRIAKPLTPRLSSTSAWQCVSLSKSKFNTYIIYIFFNQHTWVTENVTATLHCLIVEPFTCTESWLNPSTLCKLVYSL